MFYWQLACLSFFQNICLCYQSNSNWRKGKRSKLHRSIHGRCSIKKFAKFTGKDLCQAAAAFLIRVNYSLSNPFLAILPIFRSSHRRYSVRKGVLRNFAKFTGKNQYQCLFNPLSAKLTKWPNISNNSWAICRRIVWVCLAILWDWRLKG